MLDDGTSRFGEVSPSPQTGMALLCRRGLAAAVLSSLISCAAFAQSADGGPGATVYQSMFADAAPARVGQALRSGATVGRLIALAPIARGATARAAPTLSWHISDDTRLPVELVVQRLSADEPILEVVLDSGLRPGFGSVSLADFGVTLEPGVQYEWSLSLVVNPDQRSHDIFTKGAIVFVAPDRQLAASLAASTPPERIALLLQSGYWYDALETIGAQIAAGVDAEANAALRSRMLRDQALSIID